jgi:hypothetical protein
MGPLVFLIMGGDLEVVVWNRDRLGTVTSV